MAARDIDLFDFGEGRGHLGVCRRDGVVFVPGPLSQRCPDTLASDAACQGVPSYEQDGWNYYPAEWMAQYCAGEAAETLKKMVEAGARAADILRREPESGLH